MHLISITIGEWLMADGEKVHTFRLGEFNGSSLLLGCDMSRQMIIEKLADFAHTLQLSGDVAAGGKHGIALVDNEGPLFIATNEGKLIAYYEAAGVESITVTKNKS